MERQGQPSHLNGANQVLCQRFFWGYESDGGGRPFSKGGQGGGGGLLLDRRVKSPPIQAEKCSCGYAKLDLSPRTGGPLGHFCARKNNLDALLAAMYREGGHVHPTPSCTAVDK